MLWSTAVMKALLSGRATKTVADVPATGAPATSHASSPDDGGGGYRRSRHCRTPPAARCRGWSHPVPRSTIPSVGRRRGCRRCRSPIPSSTSAAWMSAADTSSCPAASWRLTPAMNVVSEARWPVDEIRSDRHPASRRCSRPETAHWLRRASTAPSRWSRPRRGSPRRTSSENDAPRQMPVSRLTPRIPDQSDRRISDEGHHCDGRRHQHGRDGDDVDRSRARSHGMAACRPRERSARRRDHRRTQLWRRSTAG